MKYSACGVEDMENLDLDVLIEFRHKKNIIKTLSIRKIPYNDVKLSSWHMFMSMLCEFKAGVFTNITYTDDEHDEISLGTDSELKEALKVAQKCNDKLKVNVEFLNENLSDDLRISLNKMSEEAIASCTSKVLPGDVCKTNADVQTECERASEEPPNWFTSYMDKLKKDLVKDIKLEIEKQMQRLSLAQKCEQTRESKLKFEQNPFRNDHCYERLMEDNEKLCKSHTGESQNELRLQLHHDGKIVNLINEAMINRDIGVDESCSRDDFNIIRCSGCGSAISGTYYSCSGCEGYTLCLKCPPGSGAPTSHTSQHVILALRRSPTCSLIRPIDWHNRRHEDFLPAGLPFRCKDPETGMSCLRSLKPVKLTMDAEFLFDETVPDGSKFAPEAIFTKRWRVVNCGIRPWTNETALRFLWGTKHFTPSVVEVPVPPLASGEEGSVEVQCTAPARPGFYESHWSFVHKDYLFGHRIWCNIQVINPVEDLKHTQAEDATFKCDEKLSAEGFVDNVNVEPEGSPSTSSDATLPDQLNDASPSAVDKCINTESDISSIVSLSSYESDMEYVVVPMPSCFNIPSLTNSTITSNLSTLVKDDKSSKTSASSSVIFLGSPCSDEAKDLSPVTDKSDHDQVEVKKQVFKEHSYCREHSESDQYLVEETPVNGERALNEKEKVSREVEDNSAKSNAEIYNSQLVRNTELLGEPMVQILPDGLVSAAAMLLKGAKAAISNVTRSSPSREQSPQEGSTTYDASLYSSLSSTLYEMGFFNRQLNNWVIEKHNGELEKILEELINWNDNDWHSYRH
ncbi:Next to BRCA1 protein 1 protein [Chamberlinius hualienensis]